MKQFLFIVAAIAFAIALPSAKAQVELQSVHTLLDEAKEQVIRRPAEAERLASNLLKIYADRGNLSILLHARAIRAQALSRLGEVDEGLTLAEEGLAQAEKHNIESFIIAELHTAIGVAHQSLGNLTSSFVAFQQAHGIWTDLGNETNEISTLISMAGLYIASGNIDRAIDQYEQVLPWVEEHDDKATHSRVLNNLAFALIEKREGERALYLLADARRLAIEANSPFATAFAYENTGHAFLQTGQLDEAEEYLNYAIKLSEELSIDLLISSASHNLGWVEFQKQNIDKAFERGLIAAEIAEKIGEKTAARDAYFLLARLERSQGNYAKAIDYYEKYLAYQNEVASDETSRRLSILEAEFQLTKKENEIELLQRNREIGDLRLKQANTFKNTAAIGAILLLSIIAILMYLLRSMSLANKRAAQKTQELLITQRELEMASKIKSDILAITSHEIRTPLNAIMGMSQILQRTDLDDDQQRFAETIHSSGEILIATLNDILDLSKIEAGRLDIRDDIFNIQDLADRLNQLWRLKAEEKGLNFVVNQADAPDQHLRGDPHRIQQIIFNLVSNAIKFTHDGCVEICFEGEVDDTDTDTDTMNLRIVVRDEGIGIPQDKLDHIFEPFHQVETGATRSFGGTGLGLAICRQLANLMGGEIFVESEVGQGSKFTITLSCRVAKDQTSAKTQKNDDYGFSNQFGYTLKILVAEDNQLNQMVIKQLLKDASVDLRFADNGQEALLALDDGDYDLILMDLHMPVMDGLQATKAIRARSDAYSNIPIIALTADAMAGDRQKVLDAGMSDYVSKPIDLDILIDTMKRHLTAADEENYRAIA